MAVQRRSGKSWVQVGKTKQSSTGRYSVHTNVRSAGRFTYRAVALPWRGARAVVSPSKVVSVRAPYILLSPAATAVKGETVKASGKLSGLNSRTVWVQRKSGSGWVNLAVTKTSRTGSYATSFRAPPAGRYLVRSMAKIKVAGKARAYVSAAKTLTVLAQYTTMTTLPKTLAQAKTGTATVRFAPARFGRAVSLQVARAGKWTTIATGRQSSTGTASFPVKAGMTPGTYSYRAVTAAAAGAEAYAGPTATMKVTSGNILPAGEVLSPGDYLTSTDGRYRLTMQSDGNLVERVTATGRALWNSGTVGNGGARLVMQSDGNAVIYTKAGVAAWSTKSSGTGSGSRLMLQTDANLVNYNSGGHAVWASSTKNDRLAPGEVLTAWQSIRSVSGAYTLTMQGSDGNLVLRNTAGAALWSSGTQGHPNARAVSQNDGNFVVYQGTKAWAHTGTGGKTSGGTMIMQDDGNLVLYRGGVATWHRGLAMKRG